MTLFDLTGKTAVITGSTKGIGKAIAQRMAGHGANVVISSRKQDACEEVTADINENYPATRFTSTAIESRSAKSRTAIRFRPVN